MNAGQMDQVVTLSRPTNVTDAFGQHTEWVTVTKVWAKCTPLRGREFFAAAATQSPASMRAEIYWIPDVQASWRLNWLGKAFDLVAAPIDVNARHEVLELMCVSAPDVVQKPAPGVVTQGAMYFNGMRVMLNSRYYLSLKPGPALPAGTLYFNGMRLMLNSSYLSLKPAPAVPVGAVLFNGARVLVDQSYLSLRVAAP